MVSLVNKKTNSHCFTSKKEAVLTCFERPDHISSVLFSGEPLSPIHFIETFKCFTPAGKMMLCPQDVTQLHFPTAQTIIIIMHHMIHNSHNEKIFISTPKSRPTLRRDLGMTCTVTS